MWESDPVLCMGPPVGATGAVAVQMIGSLFFWWAARSAVTAAPPPDGPRERAPRFLLSSTVTSWGDYKKEPATFLRHGEYHCVIGERQLPVLNSYLELQSRFADCAAVEIDKFRYRPGALQADVCNQSSHRPKGLVGGKRSLPELDCHDIRVIKMD